MSLSALLMLSGLLLGSVLAFTRHPVFALVTYVVMYFVSPQSRWWGESLPTNNWSLITALVLLVAVLLRKPGPRRLPVTAHSFFLGLVAFVGWIAIQYVWALDKLYHLDLVILFVKYAVLVVLIYACIETERDLKTFLWAQTAGGFYLGWMVYSEYRGGRFEGTGVPGANDANSAALLFVTVTIASSALFLAGRLWQRALLLGIIPMVVNSLVATISRSGFLALAAGGAVFNVMTPARYRRTVRVLSVLAVLLLLLLANAQYWGRIETIKYAGGEVQGIDTAHSRLVVIQAQWRMFRRYPLGCGHRCTAVLSPYYLDDKYLTGPPDSRARASHNVFMTLLVEQGIPGAVFYLLLLGWTARQVRALARRLRGQQGFLAQAFPAIAGALAAIFVADLFVDFLKFEARFWYLALLMALVAQTADGTNLPAVELAHPVERSL